jgi:hypothetical protein
MKNIIVILITIVSFTTKAQIYNRYDNLNYGDVVNGYYKDVNNFQNQFVGTWVYQNGQEYLEVRFVKKEMMLRRPGPKQFYADALVGEYRYIDVNGVEKVNSLFNLIENHESMFDYNMYSGSKLNQNNAPLCPTCPPNTERLYMYFSEQGNDDMMLNAKFVMRRVIENGVEKLKVQLVTDTTPSGRKKGDISLPSFFRNFSVPYGDYTLVKQ